MNVPFTQRAADDQRESRRAGNGGPTDRSALMILALLGSMLANLILLSQLFVWRPEYNAEIKEVNWRLSRIERHLGIDADPHPPAHHKAG